MMVFHHQKKGRREGMMVEGKVTREEFLYWHVRQGEVLRELYNPDFVLKRMLTFGLYGCEKEKCLQKEFDELHRKIMRAMDEP